MPDSAHAPIDFAALARRAGQLGSEARAVQEELRDAQATGYGGGGLVTATVSGSGRLVALDIDPSVIDPDDPETLSRLIIAAVDSAALSMAEQRAAHVTAVTDSLGGMIESLRQQSSAIPERPRVIPQFPSLRDGSPRLPFPPQGPPASR
jgi:DNA-binding YbaB/EbfC family protein